jgi:hypothetical protein
LRKHYATFDARSFDRISFRLPHVRDRFCADAHADIAYHGNINGGDLYVYGCADLHGNCVTDFDGHTNADGNCQADRNSAHSTDCADAHRNGDTDSCARSADNHQFHG